MPFRGFRQRFAANALSAFYSAHESQVRKWKDDGLQEDYFCYKPSFRLPGNVVKSHMHLRLAHGEYFELEERQDSKSGITSDAGERSDGFVISKSERLWMVLREEIKQQPRLFCFYRAEPAKTEKIVRLYGFLIESDKKFTGNVYRFKVALVSVETEREMWIREHPRETFDLEEQIDNIPFTEAAKERNPSIHRVLLDPQAIAYIKPDVVRYENDTL